MVSCRSRRGSEGRHVDAAEPGKMKEDIAACGSFVAGVKENGHHNKGEGIEVRGEEGSSTSKDPTTCWGKTKGALMFLGPAWMVVMAYLDPGNLEGDLLAGAMRDDDDSYMGYRLLWVILWSTIMGFLLQRLAIRLGTATGQDLATLCHKEFPRWMTASVWLVLQLGLVGVDMQGVIGSAIAFKLLFGIPFVIGIVITLIDTFIVLLVDFFGVRETGSLLRRSDLYDRRVLPREYVYLPPSSRGYRSGTRSPTDSRRVTPVLHWTCWKHCDAA